MDAIQLITATNAPSGAVITVPATLLGAGGTFAINAEDSTGVIATRMAALAAISISGNVSISGTTGTNDTVTISGCPDSTANGVYVLANSLPDLGSCYIYNGNRVIYFNSGAGWMLADYSINSSGEVTCTGTYSCSPANGGTLTGSTPAFGAWTVNYVGAPIITGMAASISSSGTSGSYLITFQGSLSDTPISLMSTSSADWSVELIQSGSTVTTTSAPTTTATPSTTTSGPTTTTTPAPTTTTTRAPTTTTTPGPVIGYQPYGSTGGMPIWIGGVEDQDSLKLEGIGVEALTQGWYPQIKPGRYVVDGENTARYQYAYPLSVPFNSSEEGQTVEIELPAASFNYKAFYNAPVMISDQTGTPFLQICQSIRFGQPVPPPNTVTAATLVNSAYLYTGDDPNETSGLCGTDTLWWYPTFGGQVLEVRRSQNSRSFDVLADQGALMYPVETPDQLSDDRGYFFDERAGIVYGKTPASTLPAIPFSTGENAMTYVSMAYPTETYHTLRSLGQGNEESTYWTNYFATNASFFTAYEGLPCGTGNAIMQYDPIRMEEIGYVDRDGLIRLRHKNLPLLTNTAFAPSVVFLSPSGPILCQTTLSSGNVIDAKISDPSQGGAMAYLPYGTTVVARYYVNNSFCLLGVTGSPRTNLGAVLVFVRSLGSSTGGTFTYEGDPDGLFLPHITGSTPDINPLNTQTESGFFWLESQDYPPVIPPSITGRLTVGNTRPAWNNMTSTGEEFTVMAQGLDNTQTPIPGVTLVLGCIGAGVTIIARSVISGLDGTAYFRVRLTGTGCLPGFTLTLTDSRNTGLVLDSIGFLPGQRT